MVLMFYSVPGLYDKGPIAVLLVAIAISAVMMQLVAHCYEARWMWPPRAQFRAFIYGDTIFLPLTALSLAVVYQNGDGDTGLVERGWWHGALIIVIVLLAAASRMKEEGDSFYSSRQMNSPTKLWHDLVVIPVFAMLLLYPLPEFLTASFSVWHLIAVLGFAVWLGLLIEPTNSPKCRTAHIDYDWENHYGARNN